MMRQQEIKIDPCKGFQIESRIKILSGESDVGDGRRVTLNRLYKYQIPVEAALWNPRV